MNKICEECRYLELHGYDTPCYKCNSDYSSFEPELKAGMIVKTDTGKFMILVDIDGILCGFGVSQHIEEIVMDDVKEIFEPKEIGCLQFGINNLLTVENLKSVWKKSNIWDKVAKGTQVLVRGGEYTKWQRAYFSHLGGNGRPLIFSPSGTDSWTSNGLTGYWSEVVLYNGNEHLIKE